MITLSNVLTLNGMFLALKICPFKIDEHLCIIKMEKVNEQHIKLTGKRKMVARPIHEYGVDGKEFLRCPYQNCSRIDSYTGNGKKAMSKHMKRHGENGHSLKLEGGITTVIQMYDKYVAPEMSHVPEGRNIASPHTAFQDGNVEEIPTAEVEELKKGASDTLNKLYVTFVEWKVLPDEEFVKTVSYPTFAKAMMSHAMGSGRLIKTSLELISRSISTAQSGIEVLKKAVDSFTKVTAEVRGDMTKMTDAVFKQALEVESAAADVKQANYLMKSADVRDNLIREGETIVKNGLSLGLKEFEKQFNKEIDKKVRECVYGSLKSVERIGLPSIESLASSAAAILSKEMMEEDEKLMAESEKMARFASKLAKRQVDAILSPHPKEQAPEKKTNDAEIYEVIFEGDEINYCLAAPSKSQKPRLEDVE